MELTSGGRSLASNVTIDFAIEEPGRRDDPQGWSLVHGLAGDSSLHPIRTGLGGNELQEICDLEGMLSHKPQPSSAWWSNWPFSSN